MTVLRDQNWLVEPSNGLGRALVEKFAFKVGQVAPSIEQLPGSIGAAINATPSRRRLSTTMFRLAHGEGALVESPFAETLRSLIEEARSKAKLPRFDSTRTVAAASTCPSRAVDGGRSSPKEMAARTDNAKLVVDSAAILATIDSLFQQAHDFLPLCYKEWVT